MEEKKNLCAPIPLSLHQRLRAEQEQRDYLARNGLKQKDFILGLIERELNDAGNEE